MSAAPAHDVLVVPNGAFADAAAGRLAQAIRARAAEGIVSVALAGGSTPRLVYVALAGRTDVPWKKVRVYFGDERAVPPDAAGSNYGMARESLLSRAPIPDAHVFRMHAEESDLETAAAAYDALLPDRLDVLILGVGADGHTASLFPASAAVRETTRRVVPALARDPPRGRLTITRPVIERARRTIVLATGGEKAAAVREALEGREDPEGCPAQLARDGLWILDVAAAARLDRLPGVVS